MNNTTLKIIGTKALFDAAARDCHAPRGAVARNLSTHGMKAIFAPDDIEPEDFVCLADQPAIIVLEARNMALLNRIVSMQHRIAAIVRENPGAPLVLAPVIVVFHRQVLLDNHYDIPGFVSDWLFADAGQDELMHRVLSMVRRHRVRKVQLQIGPVTFIRESRSVMHGDATVRLSPSEFALAELFFSRLGAVIPLDELTALFKATGKSTEANNIRVAIYQLRLKLEALTGSQIRLATVYRKGYCLKQLAVRRAVPGPVEAATAVRAEQLAYAG